MEQIDNKAKSAAIQTFTAYLEQSNRRKTPERFAILDAVYSTGGHFSLEDIGEELEKKNFHVSRGTLYNTMRLLVRLRIVVSHHFRDGTKYEACLQNGDHCHQICTVCGKVTELNLPTIVEAIKKTHLKRFHKDAFTLNIFGICSSCQAKFTHNKRINKGNKQIIK